MTLDCSSYELVVIGGGPAGLAAATLAAAAGVQTVLFDENPGVGGQIYRGITTTPVAQPRDPGRRTIGPARRSLRGQGERRRRSSTAPPCGASIPNRLIGVSIAGQVGLGSASPLLLVRRGVASRVTVDPSNAS